MNGVNKLSSSSLSSGCSSNNNNKPSLPAGWEADIDDETGKIFYIDHGGRKTQWFDPRDKLTKPATVADCIGDELPFGWEKACSPAIGVYYIDHINRRNQVEDPRQECRNMQIKMLESYLRQAESLDPISTSSVSLATGSQQQHQDQSLERMNSSFLHLDLNPDQLPSAATPSQQPPHHPHSHFLSSCDRDTDREVQLQQSLADSKSRVAQLKRELDTNARLLTLIEKYKTRDDEFAVQV